MTLQHTQAQNRVDTTIGIDVRAAADYRQTVHKICDTTELQRLKANAIFNWVTHNIKYKLPQPATINIYPVAAQEVYRRRWGNADDIALLYAEMCKEAGMKAVVIEGYTHEWFYDKGDMMMLPRHTWNAVLVNDKWEFADAAFGAGYVELYKSSKQEHDTNSRQRFWEKYSSCFMQDAVNFRTTHLPADPIWQLTEHTMPIETFEKGVPAVERFNKKYIFDIKRDNPDLLLIAQMDREERMQHYADRAYKYNANYLCALGMKLRVEANALITLYNRRDNRKYAYLEMLELAIAKLGDALKNYKEQYKIFKPYYDELDKKSVLKNKETLYYTRNLRPVDKQNAAKCAMYLDMVLKNAANYEAKSKTIKERTAYLDADSINRIHTLKSQRNAADREMLSLTDSVNARNAKADKIAADLNGMEFDMIGRASQNYERLQQWVERLHLADSFMREEMVLRKKLYDNNDTEMVACLNAFREARYGTTDTLLKYQLLHYDTVTRLQASVINNYQQLVNLYKANLKDIEQYRRNNNTDSSLVQQYPMQVQQYKYTVDKYCEMLSSFAAFETKNAELYGDITTMYENEMKTLDEIDLAENVRNTTERHEIIMRREYDEQENLRYQADIENQVKEVERMIAAELAKTKY